MVKLTEDQVQALRDWGKKEEELSLKEDIVQVLKAAEKPLTQDEIIDRVQEIRELREERGLN